MSTPQHSTRKHSLLAPSKAATWTVCTAQPSLEEENRHRIVEQSSVYADHGTAAHEVADALMRGTRIPKSDRWSNKEHEEMVKHAHGYRRYIMDVCGGSYDPAGVELEVPLFYRKEDNGHVDFCQILPGKVVVVDYKYGAGVKVDAVGNKQMSIYAMSAILAKDVMGSVTGGTKIHLAIYQPRTSKEEGEGPASEWITTFDELNLFCERDIAIPAHLIQTKQKHLLKFAPSDYICRWCPCKEWCDARNEHLVTGLPVVRYMTKPEPITPTPPDRITDDNLATILRHAPGVKQWLDDCEDYAFRRAKAGNPVPGTKLVEGRGSRSWADEEKATRAMKKAGIEPYKKTILSPAQAENEGMDVEVVRKLAARTPGKPVLALADDKRKEFQLVSASEEFQPVNPDLESLL